MIHIENIVIGKPRVEVYELLGIDLEDYKRIEEEKTLFTDERYLPKLLVEAGIVKSTSEVRRNKPELIKTLGELDFIELKWGRKRLWIVVGD